MSPFAKSLIIFFLGVIGFALFVWYFATDSEKRKLRIGTLLTILLTGLGIYIVKAEKLQKGIDLEGGVSYTVRINAPDGRSVTTADAEAAKEIIERRLSPLGNKDVVITTLGEDRINVEVPGISKEESQKNRAIIEKVAKLDFRLVNQEGYSLISQRAPEERVLEPGWVEVPDLQKAEPKVDENDPEAVKKAELEKVEKARANQGKSAEDQQKERLEKIYKEKQTILVKQIPEMSGKSVKDAVALPNPAGMGWMISVELESEYGDKMEQITRKNRGQPLAIVVDDEVISAPTIQSEFGANFQITGDFSQKEATDLASMLMNPLESKLQIEQISMTSPTYGEALIKQGLYAGAGGLLAILVFMCFYYRLAGIVSVIGLVVNLLLLLAAMVIFDFTLTMPGIAGIILTLGVAIDANVLIYERMREEFLAGRTLSTTLNSSYNKAFSAIFDANITGLITSVIMIAVSTGAIRGFGVTLTIGILASLFSALLITRICFRWMQHGGLEKLSFLNLISNRLIDFMKMAKPTAILSAVLVCASLAIIFIRGKESLGYELRGGDLIAVTGATEAEVRNVLGTGLKGHDGKAIAYNLQSVNPVGSEKPSVNIRTTFGDGDVLREALVKSNQQGIEIGDTQSVGAAVGGESLIRGLWAIGLGMLGIFIYLTLRYEIPFAVGGIVAIAHDVIIAAGACALFGKEIGMILIGAFLTIAGYSINDTIVIFDRIRENLRTSTDGLPAVVNKSVSETLSRTLITSGSTALAVIAMLVFGGQTMADFSFAMLIGMVVGTYSTIFVASPVVVWWAKYRKLNLQKSVLDAELLKATIHSGLEREAPSKDSPAPAQ